ncbi:MAG: AraC family transcriptional regulator [Chitinophagaceae bacterium]|nr:MAG: AraC family transcriptional regulator [Chitinophagaceae bacterium]
MLLSNDTYGPIHFELSDNNISPAIKGVNVYRAMNQFGDFFHQFFTSKKGNIHLFELRTKEPIVLNFTSAAGSINSKICLGREMNWQLKDEPKLLTKGQLLICGSAHNEASLHCLADSRYSFLALDYSVKTITQLQRQYPEISNAPGILLNSLADAGCHAAHAPNNILQITRSLLSREVHPSLLNFYLENKLRELLFELWASLQSIIHPRQHALDEICREVHDFILSNVAIHKTIPELAKQFHINELYLKNRFKKMYGVGIFEFLHEERMNMARNLLLTTDLPIKDISCRVGLKYTTSLSTAFRLHFGQTPASLRQQ